ncbi:glycosyltransferase family 2 protein [archaeon]|jgi:glycosyltransferase involved in cell wall biosynthesis|nr:glycosyltransferase family 2 protein [archaeon]MBT4441404.1 glycosyltransferase family 2 protein [archaeon]
MISVIIPIYNSSKTLERCLKSIFNSNFKDFEVIIVDDQSKDNSVEIAKKFNVTVIRNETNSGPAITRNNGAKIAKGDILAFVDSDCVVPEEWLKKFYDYLKNNKDVVAVTGPYSGSVKKKFMCLFQHYDILYFQRNSPKFLNSCSSSNLACRKNAFIKVNGFPPIMVNEDMEFASKLSKIGKIYWFKNNGVLHDFRSEFKPYFKQQISWAVSMIRSYLSKPNMMKEKVSFSRFNIVAQLTLTGLLVLSLLTGIFISYFLIVSLLLFLMIMGINFGFLSYIKKEINFKFAVLSGLFIFVRNIIWIYGLILGFIKYFLKKDSSYW